MYPVYRMENRTDGAVMKQHLSGEAEYLTFPMLEQLECIRHLFSTRLGGVSTGMWETMNLSFNRGDNPEHVLENFRRIARILETDVENMVYSKQTHTTNIRHITSADKGKGIVKELDYDDIDGLITDEPGIVLVTSYADCVPLYFVDPVREAIGLGHSGWRGTADEMGRCMVERMQETFGCRPEDIYAAIGPSICKDCYEVGLDVAEVFLALETEQTGRYVYPGAAEGKYQLDLWAVNKQILLKAGIFEEHIQITDICTCHNPEYLFSHRASKGRRGNLGAFLMLKES